MGINACLIGTCRVMCYTECMNIVIVGGRTGIFCKKNKELTEALEGERHKVTGIFRAPGDEKNMMADINAACPELLLTEDLEGFEMCTLTDAVSYNLVHCRQFHFLFSEGLKNEKYLSKQLSLVMTFVCSDEDRAGDMMSRYPDIPEVVPANAPYPDDPAIDGILAIVNKLIS